MVIVRTPAWSVRKRRPGPGDGVRLGDPVSTDEDGQRPEVGAVEEHCDGGHPEGDEQQVRDGLQSRHGSGQRGGATDAVNQNRKGDDRDHGSGQRKRASSEIAPEVRGIAELGGTSAACLVHA